MRNIFYTSDLHLGHLGICKFTNYDGSKVRPWDDVDEMNEALIDNWNSVVNDDDKIYVLGDIVMNLKHLPLMGRMKGSKRLIRGNHDIFSTKEYMKYFKEIYGVRVLGEKNAKDRMILSHIPLDPNSITYRFNINVHGHTHGNDTGNPLHYNMCVEKTNYTPMSHEDLILDINNRNLGYENNKDI
jgi:calcineurin-like phosphoesterase family protein